MPYFLPFCFSIQGLLLLVMLCGVTAAVCCRFCCRPRISYAASRRSEVASSTELKGTKAYAKGGGKRQAYQLLPTADNNDRESQGHELDETNEHHGGDSSTMPMLAHFNEGGGRGELLDEEDGVDDMADDDDDDPTSIPQASTESSSFAVRFLNTTRGLLSGQPRKRTVETLRVHRKRIKALPLPSIKDDYDSLEEVDLV